MTEPMSEAEADQIKTEAEAAGPGATWRWFLRANPQDAVAFANRPPAQTAGEAVFSVRDNGQTDTFLFF